MEGIGGLLTEPALEQGAFFVFSVVLLWIMFKGNKDHGDKMVTVMDGANKAMTEQAKEFAESSKDQTKIFVDEIGRTHDRHANERREMMNFLSNKAE